MLVVTTTAALPFVTKVVAVPILMARAFGKLSDERLGSGERVSPAVTVRSPDH